MMHEKVDHPTYNHQVCSWTEIQHRMSGESNINGTKNLTRGHQLTHKQRWLRKYEHQ